MTRRKSLSCSAFGITLLALPGASVYAAGFIEDSKASLEMRNFYLNRDFRQKDQATNVLSFPGGVPGYLGDVALALGVVRREARGAGRRVAAHFAHLVAHGALHLAGHDHLQAGEARRMERAEARVMRRLGLPNPWRGAT